MNMKISKWDAADYLKTRKDIAIYLDEILKIAREDNMPELFIEALGDVTRAQGMTDQKKGIHLFQQSLKFLNFLI